MTDRPYSNAHGTAPRTTADTDRSTNTDRGADTDQIDADEDPSIDLLHVEPDPRAAEVVAAFIDWGLDGVTVESVDRLADALGVVGNVDCVVTEHRLPDGTGVELVEYARGRDVRTPILFHTTCHDSLVESDAISAGADAYVRKRSNAGQYDCLLRAIRGHVRTAGSGDAKPDPSDSTHAPAGRSESAPMPLLSEE